MYSSELTTGGVWHLTNAPISRLNAQMDGFKIPNCQHFQNSSGLFSLLCLVVKLTGWPLLPPSGPLKLLLLSLVAS